MRRWSKLQKALYELFVPGLPVQLHCTVHRRKPSASGSHALPRYWITLEKQIIWEYPKDFSKELKKLEPYGMYYHNRDVSRISDVIRQYIDTPKTTIMEFRPTLDSWGLSDILKACDRRLTSVQCQELMDKTRSDAARIILARRQTNVADSDSSVKL